MPVKKNPTLILIVALVIVAAIGPLAGVLYSKAKNPISTPAIAASLSEDETNPEIIGKAYPLQYESYLKSAEMGKGPSKYKGSVPESALDKFPYMRTLWEGMPFSKEYNENRGHVYALTDVKKIKRVNDKTPLTCMTCKSPQVPRAIKEMGDGYYKANFLQNKDKFVYSISCADCHNPKTMELTITRPALKEALQRQGKDLSRLTRQEMRTLVCAQCHVEYYFEPGTGKLTFPWDKGTEPEQMYAYYQEKNFKDWDHPKSKDPMLKAQHPEYEFFQGSTHQSAGVACADCHMPYKMSGTTKFSSHWVTSPLKTMKESCSNCHGADLDKLKERVFYTQDKVKDSLDRAGNANAEAIKAINEAMNTPGVNDADLKKARDLHREAQFYWDLVSAENSLGFHNPSKALSTLAKSIDLARQAKEAADAVWTEALKKGAKQ